MKVRDWIAGRIKCWTEVDGSLSLLIVTIYFRKSGSQAQSNVIVILQIPQLIQPAALEPLALNLEA